MWDLPRPGLEPVSPALAGGFLTTAPPQKSLLSNSYMPDMANRWTLMCNPLMRNCHCDFSVMRVSLGLTNLRGHTGSREQHQPKFSQLLLYFPHRTPNTCKGHLFKIFLRIPRILLKERLWDAALHILMGQQCLLWVLQMPFRNVQCSLVKGSMPLIFLWVRNPKGMLSVHSSFKIFLVQMVQPLLTLLLVPDTGHRPWLDARASHHSELRTTDSLRSSRLCCWVQLTTSGFTFAYNGPCPRSLPRPCSGRPLVSHSAPSLFQVCLYNPNPV